MAVYNKNGSSLSTLYGKTGSSLTYAYDVEGITVFGGSPSPVDPMDWSSMTENSKQNISDIVSYTSTYLSGHSGAYAFPVITDVHDKWYNEPNYILYHFPNAFDKFMFLGDIANAYSQAQMDGATAYMAEANTINVFPLVGNHELGGWAEGDDLPIEWYSPLVPQYATIMQGTDALVYYFDDSTNNVRFIVLDSCTPIYQQSGTLLLTKNQLEFFASALDSSGTKDIILLNHAPGQSYYYLTDTEHQTAISTTGITNRTTMDSIINAYKNRTSVTFTDDSSVSHTHDYSSKTGSFIGLIAGHTHHAGYNNANGYNVLICPSSYYNTDAGISVFIIDKNLSKVIWLIAYKNQSTYGLYEYTY